MDKSPFISSSLPHYHDIQPDIFENAKWPLESLTYGFFSQSIQCGKIISSFKKSLPFSLVSASCSTACTCFSLLILTQAVHHFVSIVPSPPSLPCFHLLHTRSSIKDISLSQKFILEIKYFLLHKTFWHSSQEIPTQLTASFPPFHQINFLTSPVSSPIHFYEDFYKDPLENSPGTACPAMNFIHLSPHPCYFFIKPDLIPLILSCLCAPSIIKLKGQKSISFCTVLVLNTCFRAK